MNKQVFQCTVCNKPILEQAVEALGKHWHKEHFQCGHCKQELGVQVFFQHNGVPYCEVDHTNLFLPKCPNCNGAVLDGVPASGKHWHKEHFKCVRCHEELSAQNFLERDGVLYCEKDYHENFSPKCAQCNTVILGECLTALKKTWHPEHFFCTKCRKPFDENNVQEKDGKPYCIEDYTNLFLFKCAVCNLPILEECISTMNSKLHPTCYALKDSKF